MQVKIGKFSFRAIGKALVFGESDGFVKLVVEEGTNKLLGAHMVGPHVTDMITEARTCSSSKCNSHGYCTYYSSTPNNDRSNW